MPPTQFILSGRIRSATLLSRRPFLASTRCRSLGPKGTPGAPPPPQPPPRDPRGPKGPRGKGAKGTQGDPRDPRGPEGSQGDPRGPKGTQGRLRRPWGDGPMGPFGVIPKLFRMEKPFRVEGYYERKPTPKPKKAVREKIIKNSSKTDHVQHRGALWPEITPNATERPWVRNVPK